MKCEFIITSDKDTEINNFRYSSLTNENIRSVYEMCEENVEFLSREFQSFEKVTLKSDSFKPEFTIVVSDSHNEIIAFFMVIIRRTYILRKIRRVAVLKFFVVKKSFRNKGIATKIFNVLLKRIKESKEICFKMKLEVMVSMPDYWCPGLDPRHTEAFFFLKKLGFKRGKERVNLCIKLTEIPNDKPQSEVDGFVISRAHLDDKEELIPINFMPRHFQVSFWPDEIALTFHNNPITTYIARNLNSNRIEGWASHSAHFPGSFGPTGVKKSARGKGVASLLLKWCLWDIKQAGLNKATIMWVKEDTIYFYLKSIGAHICEFYWVMKQRI